jgi:hypothetical protein
MVRNSPTGGVAQEQIVSKRLLKFVNTSTTPLTRASRQSEKHIADKASGGGAIATEVLAKKES